MGIGVEYKSFEEQNAHRFTEPLAGGCVGWRDCVCLSAEQPSTPYSPHRPPNHPPTPAGRHAPARAAAGAWGHPAGRPSGSGCTPPACAAAAAPAPPCWPVHAPRRCAAPPPQTRPKGAAAWRAARQRRLHVGGIIEGAWGELEGVWGKKGPPHCHPRPPHGTGVAMAQQETSQRPRRTLVRSPRTHHGRPRPLLHWRGCCRPPSTPGTAAAAPPLRLHRSRRRLRGRRCGCCSRVPCAAPSSQPGRSPAHAAGPPGPACRCVTGV